MKRMFNFAGRVTKDILRDPISYVFTIGMPLALMMMYYYIGKNVNAANGPNAYPMGSMDILTPGIVVFSFSFTMLNISLLLSKDRATSFLTRLYTSPMRAMDFAVGYTIPLFIMSLVQAALCFLLGFILGLQVEFGRLLLCYVSLFPIILLYIAFGLLFGALLNDKAAPPLSSMVVTVSTLLGGVWFPIEVMGKTFSNICYALPFANSVKAARIALSGNLGDMLQPLLITLLYTLGLYILAVWIFSRKMKKDND